MNKYTFLASTVLLAISSQGLAQSVTDDRFCKQYANQVTDISKEAIAKNKSCLDFSRGVHAFHQMHYNWCLKNTRETVYGAADNIGRLADQCTSPGISQNGSSDKLGRVWYEQESGWSGTWERVGNSSRFQATWTHPNGGTVKADLTITLQGENVQVIRRDTFGPHTGRGCKYTGRLHGNRVSGKYSCDWAGGQILWSAQISQ